MYQDDFSKFSKQTLHRLTGLTMERSLSKTLVGLSRLELLTSRLSGGRSNRLSYRPVKIVPD